MGNAGKPDEKDLEAKHIRTDIEKMIAYWRATGYISGFEVVTERKNGRTVRRMVVFELSMPGWESWNGCWFGEGRLYARVLRNKDVPKEFVGKDFLYHLNGGCTACVSTRSVSSSEANKIRKESCGFCGYDWMIRSICNKGEIIAPNKGR